jgi:CRP-like cAMP-binding protein
MLSLSRSKLFKDITLEELELISDHINVKTLQYTPEEVIQAQDEMADKVYILLEGVVKGVMEDINGHIYQVEMFNEADIIAPANLFSSRENLPITLIAKTETRLIPFTRGQILTMFSLNRKIEENFLRTLSDKVIFLAEKLWENQFSSIEDKIYKFVLAKYLIYRKNEFEINLTHEELSHRFGVSRPSLSRSLIKINQSGIINTKGKKIKILDFEQLLQKAE